MPPVFCRRLFFVLRQLKKYVHPQSLHNLYTFWVYLDATFMRNCIAFIMKERANQTAPGTFDEEACAMRVYVYSPETGYFQGEDFIEDSRLDTIEGATRVVPPVYHRGELPVFDRSLQCWRVVTKSEHFPDRHTEH